MKINFLQLLLILAVYFSSLVSSNDEVFKQLVNNYDTAKNFMGIGSILTIGGMIWQSHISKDITKNLQEKTRNLIDKTVCFATGAGSAVLTLYGITKYNLRHNDASVLLPLSIASGCFFVLAQFSGLKASYDWEHREQNEGAEGDDRPRQLTQEERRVTYLLLLSSFFMLCATYCHDKLNQKLSRLHFT